MGVKIGDLLVKRPIELEELRNKSIAIDAYNTIYQFLSIIRQRDGTPLMDENGNVTSHLSGIFYRNIKLLERGIKLVYVFDGKPPEWKSKTIDERSTTKKIAEEKWREALKEGDLEAARKYAQATSRITPEILKESKELLSAMGIPYVEAPAEGEAQAAYMAKQGKVDYSASQDYDSLLFGSPNLIRNLTLSGRRKLPGRNSYVEIGPEYISLEESLRELGIPQEKLIWIGLLTGTDYNDGVKGIGPKKGLKLVKKCESLEELYNKVRDKTNEDLEFWRELVDFFKNPDVINVDVKYGKFDRERIIEILTERHNFSRERIESAMVDLLEIKKQENLSKWF